MSKDKKLKPYISQPSPVTNSISKEGEDFITPGISIGVGERDCK